MSNSSATLRQIFTDARPLVEQALDLSEQFAAFRELATQNGLDWSQIKALLKAQVQDERADDGKDRVGRIIEKADFATAYADMLGLGSGTSNMNEDNFSPGFVARVAVAEERRKRLEEVEADLPPHDEDGVIIEPSSVTSDDEAGQGEGRAWPSSVAPPTISDVPANGPATGTGPQELGSEDASPSEEAAGPEAASSPINSEICSPGWSTDPQITRACDVEAGLRVTRAQDGIISGDETTERFLGTTAGGLDVCQLDRPLLVTAGETAPLSQSADAPQPADAPGECSPSRDCTPGAPHTGEWPELPPQFDRRSKAA